MRGRLSGRTPGVLVLTGSLLGAVAACGDPPVSPLPIQISVPAGTPAPTAAPVDSPAPVTTTAAAAGPQVVTTTRRSRRPDRTPDPTPTTTPPTSAPVPPPACQGAVRYDLDAAAPESVLVQSLCLGTGAVLRITNAGPEAVTADPAELVSRAYEAAVTDLTFLGPGTVTVTITRQDKPHVIAVVVQPTASTSASSSTSASPAG